MIIKLTYMEDYKFEMINLFNKNFKCTNYKKILKLYKKDISSNEYFEKNNIKEEKLHHPLFKNYNYCLFCGQKRKTKYYSQNLINSHLDLREKTIGDFLLNNNIKLREIKNTKIKIGRRRFINSYDNININTKYEIEPFKYRIENDSDTGLYIYKKRITKKPKRKNTNLSKNITKSENKLMNLSNFDKMKILKKSLSKKIDEKTENKLKKFAYDYNENNNFVTPGKNNLINKSTERIINIEDSIHNDKHLKLDYIKININQDKVNHNLKNDLDDENCAVKIKESNELSRKKSKGISKHNKKRNFKNDSSLIDSSNINSDIKFESDKDREKNKINKSSELINLKKEEDKISNNSNKILDIFNGTKKFLGLSKRNSQAKEFIRRRNVSNNDLEINNKLKQKKSKNYIEKNDNCTICLNEIKEKFTLICGDFFCRDCIKETIITAMKEISNLDKLSCPTCNELLEENTIKKLLSEEDYQKYINLITKIKGLKNKNYTPCPYPDCPGWGEENQSNHNINILTCQYNHLFCKKCLNIVKNPEYISLHICYEETSEEEKNTNNFFKQNKSYRKCPNCQTMVVRETGGCNNMTCTNVWCGYEFCWLCNKKYDESHYKNPLSMCFGLSDMNYEGRLAKYSRDRFFRCVFIFFLIIFVILPVILVFFSIFEVILYIISFVLDGSAMKNIKLKSLFAHKFFYKVIYLFYIFIGIAYIPVGYMSIAFFLISAPILCIYNKIKEKSEEDID